MCEKEYLHKTDKLINKLMTLHFKTAHPTEKYDPKNSINKCVASMDDSKGAMDYKKLKERETAEGQKIINKYENVILEEKRIL
jgi:hypothetical protein